MAQDPATTAPPAATCGATGEACSPEKENHSHDHKAHGHHGGDGCCGGHHHAPEDMPEPDPASLVDAGQEVTSGDKGVYKKVVKEGDGPT